MIKKYTKIPAQIEAVLFKYNPTCIDTIIYWVTQDNPIIKNINSGKSRHLDGKGYIEIYYINGGLQIVNEGDYIIKDEHGIFNIMEPNEFLKTYKEIIESGIPSGYMHIIGAGC